MSLEISGKKNVNVVIDRRKERPVYVLKAEDGSGIERILHHNLLLPCTLLPFEETLSSDKRKEKSKSSSYRRKNPVDSETSDSDSSCDYTVYRVVSDEVTESFPVSQQATLLFDSSSHHDQESDYSDNQDERAGNSDQQVASNDIEELDGEEIDEEQNTEILSELSSTKNTHLNSDENVDNELQNTPRYPKRNHRQPERLAYNHLGEPSYTSYVMSTHSNDIEELDGEEIDEEKNIEIVSELSSTKNTHLNSDENVDNGLQNPPRYSKRSRRQPERLACNNPGEPSKNSYVMSTHLQTRPFQIHICFLHTGRHQGRHFLIIITFYHHIFHTVLNS